MEREIIQRKWNHPEAGDSWVIEFSLPADWVEWIEQPWVDRAGNWQGSGKIHFPEGSFRVRISGSETVPGGYFGYWETLPEEEEKEEEFFQLLWKYALPE
jgi:hypothetical protein